MKPKLQMKKIGGILEFAHSRPTESTAISGTLDPECLAQVLCWYCGNPYEKRHDVISNAMELLVWCDKHNNLDFLPEEMRNRTLKEASARFHLSRERIIQLLVTFPPLLQDRRVGPIYIAFEGIDGSGKTRHLAMLEQELRQAGSSVISFSFPVYEKFFGTEVGNILSGKHPLGADKLDPRSMSLWYALDRWQAFRSQKLDDADYILLNRFTLSSAVYQSIRVPKPERNALTEWIFELEHGQLGLPFPHLYIVLDVAPNVAQQNVRRKGFREYSGKELDIYERSSKLLIEARQRYLDLAATLPRMTVISCMSSENKMKSMDVIHRAILERLEKCQVLAMTL